MTIEQQAIFDWKNKPELKGEFQRNGDGKNRGIENHERRNVMGEIKELEKRVAEAQGVLEDHRARVGALESKRARLTQEIPGLEDRVRDGKAAKERTVSLYVEDEASPEDLRKAGADLIEAEARLSEARELLAAVQMRLEKSPEELRRLDAALHAAQRDLAGHQVNEIVSKVRNNGVGRLIKEGWIHQLDHGAGNYDAFLRNLFPMPSTEELQAMREELETTR